MHTKMPQATPISKQWRLLFRKRPLIAILVMESIWAFGPIANFQGLQNAFKTQNKQLI